MLWSYRGSLCSFVSNPDDKDEPAPASSALATPSLEGVEDAAPATPSSSRKLRDGARSKVKSPRELRREVFRNSLEARGNEKMVGDLRDDRPVTRDDCRGGQRPCPWVGCKHHLYLDVNPETGSVKLNFPDKELWELEETCALDVAEEHPEGIPLEAVGDLLNLTRERIRQVEADGLQKVRKATGIEEGDTYEGPGGIPARRRGGP